MSAISAMRCFSSSIRPDIENATDGRDRRRRPAAPFPMCRCCSGRSASWWRSASGSSPCSPSPSGFRRGSSWTAIAGSCRPRLFSLPLPWIAAELGWIVAEYGRQPWVIEGVLPTALGVSSTDAGQCAVQPCWASSLFYSALAGGRSLPAGQIHPAGPRRDRLRIPGLARAGGGVTHEL